jgi:hypothetical protein
MLANDTKAESLLKLSSTTIVRLQAMKDRIIEVGKRNEKFDLSASAMLADLETAMR